MFQKKSFWLILLAVIIAGGGYYYFTTTQAATAAADATPTVQTAVARRGDLIIFASGAGQIVPASEIGIGFDESGELLELLVKVGDSVDAGQMLARLQTKNTPASIASDIASAELSVLQAQQTLDAVYTTWPDDAAKAYQAVQDAEQALADLLNPELAQTQALQTYLEAQTTVDDVEQTLNNLQMTGSQADIDAAYAQLILAQNALTRAEDNYAPYANKPDDNLTKANLQAKLSAAQASYDATVRTYNALTSTATEDDILAAEADLAAAQAQLVAAEQAWEAIKDGIAPDEIAIAEAQLAAAQGAWALVKEAPAPDEIAIAEAQLANAEAKLVLAQETQAIIELTAPIDGTILNISASAGESIGTNAIITLADLEQPILEVFLDETDLDKIALGFEAEIIFDALPDDVFTGKVIEVNPSLVTVSGVQAVNALVLINPDSFAKPQTLPVGLNASVDIIGGKAENAILIPVEALRELGPDEYAVFVMEGDEPKLRIVEVGLIDFTSVEVVSGLDAGDVITTGIVETE